MAVRLIESLATTGPLADLFSDETVLQSMLRFEAALARAEARLGVIPRAAAATISAAASAAQFDAGAISGDAAHSGTPAIPFLRAFTESVRTRGHDAAGFVHWGATSQDLCDTALVLLLQKARPILDAGLVRLERALRRLSQQHRRTVMLGRTWLQAAPPVTFGLKAAGWFGAVQRGRRRLTSAFEDALVLQFGGATGTLAALGKDGPRVARALAEELRLGCPDAPWHTHRDRLAALLCACGVLTAALGKMARDIILLAQNEVAELSEPGAGGRGGSSTMPHKRNPVGSALTLAAAQRVPGLVSSFLSAMAQEHERAAGSWQAEWPIVAGVVQSTGLAVASMADVAESLQVNAERMRANIAATRGIIFAERASMLLGKQIGRDRAHKILEEASLRAITAKRNLGEVLAENPEIAQHLRPADLRDLEVPERYLGAAEEFRRALLASGPARQPGRSWPSRLRSGRPSSAYKSKTGRKK
jgi:3-carboxy-cis,cis-muconate cycloisomerase